MTLSFDAACEAVTAPGQMFALVDAEIRGRTYRVFENAFPTLPAMFEMAALRGEQTFLVYEDEAWTFEQVVAHGHSIAATLIEDLGVQKGDRVAIAMRNYPEWITSFVGILAAGAVAVPLNGWWTGEELVYGLEDSGATVMIADPERLERVADDLAGLGVTPVLARGRLEGVLAYDDVVAARRPAPTVAIEPDDDATILYTSGTTGHPKGAVATHRSHTNAIFGYWCRATVHGTIQAANRPEKDSSERDGDAAAPGEAYILTVPLFHVTGCVPVMLNAFGTGSKLVMMYRWDPRRALELVERERVTVFVGVPTMVQDMLQCDDFDRFDTSSLKSIGGGGAPAAPDLVRRVEKSFRGSPGIGYGMTETTAYGPQNVGGDYLEKPTSAGRAVPVMRVGIFDGHGNEVPVGNQGEICFYGPNIIREYWNKPEANAEAFFDGWFRSGDIGRLDDEGFVYVEDRAKDVVIRAGENIGCIEVEAVIAELPAVYEVAVFGLPHERLGEELACAIYVRPGESLSAEEVQLHVGEHLANFKIPTTIEFSPEMLPRSAQGKILKRKIRDRLAAERASA
jgi:long-chain acyl-CoA synthetase